MGHIRAELEEMRERIERLEEELEDLRGEEDEEDEGPECPGLTTKDVREVVRDALSERFVSLNSRLSGLELVLSRVESKIGHDGLRHAVEAFEAKANKAADSLTARAAVFAKELGLRTRVADGIRRHAPKDKPDGWVQYVNEMANAVESGAIGGST